MSWAAPALVPKVCCTKGTEGRKICMARGPVAVTAASRATQSRDQSSSERGWREGTAIILE